MKCYQVIINLMPVNAKICAINANPVIGGGSRAMKHLATMPHSMPAPSVRFMFRSSETSCLTDIIKRLGGGARWARSAGGLGVFVIG